MSKKNPTDRAQTETQLRTLANGLISELPVGTPLVVASVNYTSDQLAKIVHDYLDKYTGAREAHATAQQLVHDRDAAHPIVRKLLGQVQKTLEVKYDDENPILLKFGFQPKKRKAPLTHDQKVAKADKARATRAKNHPKAGTTPPPPGRTGP